MTIGSEGSKIGEYGLLIVLAMLWGASYPLIKIALEITQPQSRGWCGGDRCRHGHD